MAVEAVFGTLLEDANLSRPIAPGSLRDLNDPANRPELSAIMFVERQFLAEQVEILVEAQVFAPVREKDC